MKKIEYENVLKEDIKFSVALKCLPTKGNLVYEYNPFRNYRLSKTLYLYKDKYYSPGELYKELTGVLVPDDIAIALFKEFQDWRLAGVPDTEEDPVLMEEGQLVDFQTDELEFDIQHPVNILPLYSYDNSVNLIINDGKNKPRLINSRFSATSKNLYLIIDRKGNNDTNIYDLGSQFDLDTSLYKRVSLIPILKFKGTHSGGKLSIGNYHFYFKYSDADGNETDFIAESGLVSIFIGLDLTAHTGFRNENSNKSVLFLLSNIDSAYLYVLVYYTRSTADVLENPVVSAFRIDQKYLVNNLLKCDINITGYEDVTEVTLQDVNPLYQFANSVVSLETCLNMLFFGNFYKPEIPYKDLADISLRFLPTINIEKYPVQIDLNYVISSSSSGYYDVNFIYDKLGYWNHEIYRFGIVYILSDNSLTPVFSVRGVEKLTQNTSYLNIPFYKDSIRNYINIEEDSYKIIVENPSENLSENPSENAMGVVLLDYALLESDASLLIFSLNFKVPIEVINYLKDTLKIKGYFFVRQKRIPTILCLGYTIGIDPLSHTPVLPSESETYVSETFITNLRILDHNFEDRLYTIKKGLKVTNYGMICPEYDTDYPYYNSLFSGNQYTLVESDIQYANPYLTRFFRNFYGLGSKLGDTSTSYVTNIIGVEDNTKLVAIKDTLFSARAGEAEEAFRFEYVEFENKSEDAVNLLRGSFGPYLGIKGFKKPGKIVDIKIPGYNSMSTGELFAIRYSDKSPFYAISERIDLLNTRDWFLTLDNNYILESNIYRGDCYICLFTHRMNRNFQDPTAPLNDLIVDRYCWKDNYKLDHSVLKTEDFEKVNRGDVNAVQLGMWVTLTIRSSKNLNIRSLDYSEVDEMSMTGHPRGYYPHFPINGEGNYKVPEAFCYNKGFQKAVSERYNIEVPDVPAIKNDFTNRIAYSDIHVNDAFKNGFRVFLGTHYRDYPKTYGAITKLVELRGNLICVFEHGVALIPVNERALVGEGAGGEAYINTSNVLPENPKIISDTFGSQWLDSVIKTPTGIYGVDTIGKKIWRTNGSVFECISDFKVGEFLNLNISLKERELTPIIGIRNVKTHYNKFKGDILFTFYDNLYGFEEKVWNLCYNEFQQKWITFYSWIPSYSENIYNQFFSFDRNTSKWIAKLGISNHSNRFSDGITLGNNIITKNGLETELYLDNRVKPSGDDIEYHIEYRLERDNFGNNKLFEIVDINGVLKLKFTGNYEDITSELYARDPETGKVLKDERGRKVYLDRVLQKNPDKVVLLLNLYAHVKVSYTGTASLGEAYSSGYTNKTFTDLGHFLSTVAVIPEYNMQFLTTDFWRHGLAGIIDYSDKIAPTYWYGKLHPFEFEFIVSDNPHLHKIFDNLEIISNSAEPESFHYEIIGDCYDFANDKKNMYIRQEATKELYLHNGTDVIFDHEYKVLKELPRPVSYNAVINGIYDKSTLFPLYYSRLDTYNEVEDFYNSKTIPTIKDFSAKAGAEIVHYENLEEYRIWNHAKGVNLKTNNRLRGNMEYKEDRWLVLINPINLVQKNETSKDWENGLIPIELGQSPVPDNILEQDNVIKADISRNIVVWKWEDSLVREVKMKDKWIKIRIRYRGDKIAIINAIRTLYTASYS